MTEKKAASESKAGERMLMILGLHKVGEPSPGGWETWFCNTEAEFIAYLTYLQENRWHVLDTAAILRGLAEPDTLPMRAAVVTFDDGYLSTLEVAAPLLQKFGYPAIVFVPSACVGLGSHSFSANSREPNEPLCTWEQLRQLEHLGVSVQSHSVTHRAFSTLSPAELEEELRHSKGTLEDRLGKPVEMFAFPYGDGGTDAQEVTAALKRAGYKAACLYDDLVNRGLITDPYRLSRLTLGRWGNPSAELSAATKTD
jgi:peptidoglycan/xylan/chitin deacetylase (PgdA/CDA1 family)